MKALLLLAMWSNLISPSNGQDPCPNAEQLQLIATAGIVRDALVDNHWEEWVETPFTVLLVDEDYEFLLNRNTKDTTFKIGCNDIPYRPTTFNKTFLATFPAVNWEPTIVIGTPPNTGKSPISWVVTILHEHFHQLQFGHPDYYSSQEALNLSKGDNDGMWMLNHPFPYDDGEVIDLVKRLNSNLVRLYDGSSDWDDILRVHLRLKNDLKQLAGQDHYNYFNLQLWQEGYARFMEVELVKQWIDEYDRIDQDQFSKEELVEYSTAQVERIKSDLINGDIAKDRRTLFYSMGAAEAKLVSASNKEWKQTYFESLFNTDPLLSTILPSRE